MTSAGAASGGFERRRAWAGGARDALFLLRYPGWWARRRYLTGAARLFSLHERTGEEYERHRMSRALSCRAIATRDRSCGWAQRPIHRYLAAA